MLNLLNAYLFVIFYPYGATKHYLMKGHKDGQGSAPNFHYHQAEFPGMQNSLLKPATQFKKRLSVCDKMEISKSGENVGICRYHALIYNH